MADTLTQIPVGSYVVNWTNDNLKSPIIISPKSVDQSTSINIYGKGANNYGEGMQENILHILENFASNVHPTNQTIGQLWYDTNVNKLKIWDGSVWDSVSSVGMSPTRPTTPDAGDLWYDASVPCLEYFDGTGWVIIATDDQLNAHANNMNIHLNETDRTVLSDLDDIGVTTLNYLIGVSSPIQNQLDSKVNKAGDTMTGFLTLNSDPALPLHAATKQYIDNTIFNAFSTSAAGVSTNGCLYQKTIELTSTDNQSNFKLPFTPDPTATLVFVEGVKQEHSSYTFTGNNLTLSVGLPANTEVTIISFITGGGLNPPSANGVASIDFETYTSADGQTTFNLQNPYVVGSYNLFVWINGVKQVCGGGSGVSAYDETSTTQIVFSEPLHAGDTVEFMIINLMGSAYITRELFVAAYSGETMFTLTDPYHHTTSSSDKLNDGIALFIQGINEGPNEFTETNGGSFIVSGGIVMGMPIEFYAFRLA